MTMPRRDFLQAAGATAATAFVSSAAASADQSANNHLVLGVMGTAGRGTTLAKSFSTLPNTSVAYVCDVDARHAARAAAEVEKACGKKPKETDDFRRILDDSSVDALLIAAPDHWHAPAAILACSADKHVYVEKPCSHNPHEGELLVAASKKYQKVVQHGTQRRSMPGIQAAVQKMQDGLIGRVLFSRGWYNNQRPTIGQGKPASIPEWLNYELWQGPAPQVAYQDNVVHYNWHWFWNWGTGELGNNGIHSLDICRWGLGVDTPRQVSAGGGKYRYPDDDQQTPDTHVVTFDFDGKSIVWEGRSWSPHGFENSRFGMSFYGDEGSIVIDGGNWDHYDIKHRLIAHHKGSASQRPHFQNFLDCIRNENLNTNASAEIAHHSVMLCHYGNIAYRTGSTLQIDPKSGQIKDNQPAMALWQREYRKGWEPKV